MRLEAELIDCAEHVGGTQEEFIIRIDQMCKRWFTIGSVLRVRHSCRIWPCALQQFLQACNIQSPITFFSSRVVPFTPPSLVKLSLSACEVRTGASSSVPINDHVPELRKAVPSRAVMAATAEPVS